MPRAQSPGSQDTTLPCTLMTEQARVDGAVLGHHLGEVRGGDATPANRWASVIGLPSHRHGGQIRKPDWRPESSIRRHLVGFARVASCKLDKASGCESRLGRYRNAQ